jgi:lipopolysaccharide export system permease protein
MLCMGANLLVSLQGISWGMTHFRQTVLDFAKTKTQLVLQAGVFNQDFPGLTLFAQNVDVGQGELEMVFVRDNSKKDIDATIIAPKGRIDSDTAHGQLQIMLRDGQIYRQEKNSLSVLQFGNYMVRLDLSKLIKGYDFGEPRPKELSWATLRRHLENPDPARADAGGKFLRKVQVERHKRLALPLACLALGLFAAPLACAFQGMRQSGGLILTVVFFLVYYTLLSLGISLGESGKLAPALGLWLPDVLFLGMAAKGIYLVANEKRFDLLRLIRRLGPRRKAAA